MLIYRHNYKESACESCIKYILLLAEKIAKQILLNLFTRMLKPSKLTNSIHMQTPTLGNLRKDSCMNHLIRFIKNNNTKNSYSALWRTERFTWDSDKKKISELGWGWGKKLSWKTYSNLSSIRCTSLSAEATFDWSSFISLCLSYSGN